MKMKFFASLLLTVLMTAIGAGTAFSQDLTGIWRGRFQTFSGEQYRFEIQIQQTTSSKISGVSYSYLDKRFYGKATLTGTFNKGSQAAVVQEIKTVEVKMDGGSVACIMKCSFNYVKSGNEEFLEGTYTSLYEKTDSFYSIRKGQNCGGGTVELRRVVTSDFYVEPFLRTKPATTPKPIETPTKKSETPKPTVRRDPPKPKPNQTTTPNNNKPEQTTTVKPRIDTIHRRNDPVVTGPKVQVPKLDVPITTRSRDNQLTKSLEVSSSEISVRLYDNGEIDNDTISVYLDGRVVVSNQRLSTTPITVNLKMDESNPEHVLVMVAENLGTIPPNTSLMIVQDGDKRYQVSITSTEQKNAMVRFRYVKP